jgi:hypothetical protein
MFRKLLPFLSVFLFAGTAYAADLPPSAHESYAASAVASDTGQHHRHHRRHHRHRRHPHAV